MRWCLGLFVFCTCLTALAEGTCGRVSVFFEPSPAKDLYPARIGAIDNDAKLLDVNEHRLAPGKYTLKIYELIEAPELGVDARHRGYGKALEVVIEANKVYHIGAQFHSGKRFSRDNFWTPVIWKTGDKTCEP